MLVKYLEVSMVLSGNEKATLSSRRSIFIINEALTH